MGMSTPCLKPELFGLTTLSLNPFLKYSLLKAAQSGFRLHIGILIILENPVMVG